MGKFLKEFFGIFSFPIIVGAAFGYLYHYALHHWAQQYLVRYELYPNYNFYDYLASFDLKASLYITFYFLGIVTGFRMINIYQKAAMKDTVMVASGFLLILFWFVKFFVAALLGPIFIVIALIYVVYRTFRSKTSMTLRA